MIELMVALYSLATIVCWVVLVRIEYDDEAAGALLVLAWVWPVFAVAWVALRANDALEAVADLVRGKPRRCSGAGILEALQAIKDRYDAAPPQPASGAEGPSDDSGDLGSGKRLRDPVTGQQSVSAKGQER